MYCNVVCGWWKQDFHIKRKRSGSNGIWEIWLQTKNIFTLRMHFWIWIIAHYPKFDVHCVTCDSGMPQDQKSTIGFDVKNDSNFHAIYTICQKWNSGKILGWVHDSICNKRFWSMRNASMMPIYGNDSDINNRFLDDTHSYNAWTI